MTITMTDKNDTCSHSHRVSATSKKSLEKFTKLNVSIHSTISLPQTYMNTYLAFQFENLERSSSCNLLPVADPEFQENVYLGPCYAPKPLGHHSSPSPILLPATPPPLCPILPVDFKRNTHYATLQSHSDQLA